MTVDAMKAVVAQCKLEPYDFVVMVDGRGAIYLQGRYFEPDVTTGERELQHTRRWFLSPQMTKSEIVQTVFKCALTSYEHRCREWFHYRGKAVFGPHYDVEVLHEVCEQTDKRKE